ncbi:MAG: Sir2 family NAD-dependent protein deacetylase [Phycisphaerae bacterium]|jgi:NAD-dependent deacetylase
MRRTNEQHYRTAPTTPASTPSSSKPGGVASRDRDRRACHITPANECTRDITPAGDNLDLAADYLRSAERLVVFTGAGVSAECGIDTFRTAGGLWTEFSPDEFATWTGLVRTALWRPRRLAHFLARLLRPLAQAKPNAAHQAIAHAEKHVNVTVVTQNVDGLHQEAGSTTVREIHGSLLRVVTLRKRFVRLLTRAGLARIVRRLEAAELSWMALLRVALAIRPLAGLSWRGLVRPSAVLFGEPLTEPDWSQALSDSRRCDVMLIIGTSGVVLPAAMLPARARAAGAKLIVIDPDEPGGGDVWLRGTAGEIVPALFQRTFGNDNM